MIAATLAMPFTRGWWSSERPESPPMDKPCYVICTRLASDADSQSHIFGCPGCSDALRVSFTLDGIEPPFKTDVRSCACGRIDFQLLFTGWTVNPTGEQPAAENQELSPLIAKLEGLVSSPISPASDSPQND